MFKITKASVVLYSYITFAGLSTFTNLNVYMYIYILVEIYRVYVVTPLLYSFS